MTEKYRNLLAKDNLMICAKLSMNKLNVYKKIIIILPLQFVNKKTAELQTVQGWCSQCFCADSVINCFLSEILSHGQYTSTL